MATSPGSLKPDYDDSSYFLPSFASIRLRTLETLYPQRNTAHHRRPDKSPKGSIDAPIQELVDLINKHPSFATLSSCSGRISLFDPQLKRIQTNSNATHNDGKDEDHGTDGDDVVGRRDSGKGGFGGWMLTSHDEIESRNLIDLIGSMESSVKQSHPEQDGAQSHEHLSFKFEPMLLHVAAANVERGNQLLQIALKLGFRESGLVVTSARVTVAIRSYGLALTIPLARAGPFRPPDSYLTALVEEANRRLQLNLSRIDSLLLVIRQSIFHQQATSHSPIDSWRASCLPDLNLWGHASVTLDDGPVGSAVLCFGGYGEGPLMESIDGPSKPRRTCQRSGSIYRLRSRHGCWNSFWEHLEPSKRWEVPSRDNALGIVMKQVQFSSREGAACCLLPSLQKDVASSCIALFGGRTNPATPFGELVLCEYSETSGLAVGAAVHVDGNAPAPRWSHTFTALSGSQGRLAVVYGGRDDTATLHSLHVLSLVSDGDACPDQNRLLWEAVITADPVPPRFHHSSIAWHDHLVVFGGQSSLNNLLEPFQSLQGSDVDSLSLRNCSVWSIDLQAPHRVQIVADATVVHPRFGHQVSLVQVEDYWTVVLSGGVSIGSDAADDETPPVELYQMAARRGVDCRITVCRQDMVWDLEDSDKGNVDFGSLVHHQACMVCASSHISKSSDGICELILTGGGVSGFAFGPCWAKSLVLSPHRGRFPACTATSTNDATFPQQAAVNRGVDDPSMQPPRVESRFMSTDASVASLECPVPVLYVHPMQAKRLKSHLEGRGWLNRNHRLAPVAPAPPYKFGVTGVGGGILAPAAESCIAVPVTPECLRQWLTPPRIVPGRDVGGGTSQLAALTTEDDDDEWRTLVLGDGMREMPRSTATYARSGRRR